eukprot:jgi/Mesen1/1828/ME000142S01002
MPAVAGGPRPPAGVAPAQPAGGSAPSPAPGTAAEHAHSDAVVAGAEAPLPAGARAGLGGGLDPHMNALQLHSPGSAHPQALAHFGHVASPDGGGDGGSGNGSSSVTALKQLTPSESSTPSGELPPRGESSVRAPHDKGAAEPMVWSKEGAPAVAVDAANEEGELSLVFSLASSPYSRSCHLAPLPHGSQARGRHPPVGVTPPLPPLLLPSPPALAPAAGVAGAAAASSPAVAQPRPASHGAPATSSPFDVLDESPAVPIPQPTNLLEPLALALVPALAPASAPAPGGPGEVRDEDHLGWALAGVVDAMPGGATVATPESTLAEVQHMRGPFCPECQGTGVSGPDGELERPRYRLAQVYEWILELVLARKATAMAATAASEAGPTKPGASAPATGDSSPAAAAANTAAAAVTAVALVPPAGPALPAGAGIAPAAVATIEKLQKKSRSLLRYKAGSVRLMAALAQHAKARSS